MELRHRRIAAVVLAAGGSSRLGQPKQLLAYQGETLVRRAARAAGEAGCAPVIVVVGANGSEVAAGVSDVSGVLIVTNDRWAKGLAGSLRLGIGGVGEDPDIDGLLVMLADQPLVDEAALRKLMEAFDDFHRIVASAYDETLGVPAVIGREHFDELLQLRGDRGAGPWLRAREGRVTRIPLPQASLDIDTFADAAGLIPGIPPMEEA